MSLGNLPAMGWFIYKNLTGSKNSIEESTVIQITSPGSTGANQE